MSGFSSNKNSSCSSSDLCGIIYSQAFHLIEDELSGITFVRAHRENNFPLYVGSLEAIVGSFFAFDLYNYARWVPVHIRDMTSLPASMKEEFQNKWVASGRFSNIPLDQVHEQENAQVKGGVDWANRKSSSFWFTAQQSFKQQT